MHNAIDSVIYFSMLYVFYIMFIYKLTRNIMNRFHEYKTFVICLSEYSYREYVGLEKKIVCLEEVEDSLHSTALFKQAINCLPNKMKINF